MSDLDSFVDQLTSPLQSRLSFVPGLFKVQELCLQPGLELPVRRSVVQLPASLQSLRVRGRVSN